MSAELIGILSVGVALLVGLGGLILTIAGWLRGDIRALGERMAGLEQRMAGLEQRVARFEGLIERVFRPSEAAEPAGD